MAAKNNPACLLISSHLILKRRGRLLEFQRIHSSPSVSYASSKLSKGKKNEKESDQSESMTQQSDVSGLLRAHTGLVNCDMNTYYMPSSVTSSLSYDAEPETPPSDPRGATSLESAAPALCAQAFRSRSPFYMYVGDKVTGHTLTRVFFVRQERRKFPWFYDVCINYS